LQKLIVIEIFIFFSALTFPASYSALDASNASYSFDCAPSGEAWLPSPNASQRFLTQPELVVSPSLRCPRRYSHGCCNEDAFGSMHGNICMLNGTLGWQNPSESSRRERTSFAVLLAILCTVLFVTTLHRPLYLGSVVHAIQARFVA